MWTGEEKQSWRNTKPRVRSAPDGSDKHHGDQIGLGFYNFGITFSLHHCKKKQEKESFIVLDRYTTSLRPGAETFSSFIIVAVITIVAIFQLVKNP